MHLKIFSELAALSETQEFQKISFRWDLANLFGLFQDGFPFIVL